MKNSSYSTPILDAVYKYDMMMASTRRMFHEVLIPMFMDCKSVFPSQGYIAEEMGLGTTQVKKCIKEAKLLGALKTSPTPKCRSLTYHIDNYFIEACVLIKACHFYLCWKKCRESVIQNVAEDELFFAKLLLKRGELSTQKVSTYPIGKVSTILILSSLTNPVRRDREGVGSTNREQASWQKENPTPIKAGSPYLFGLKLTSHDVETLTFRNAPLELKKAREILDFMRYKKDVVIHNHAAFIISQINKGRTNARRS